MKKPVIESLPQEQLDLLNSPELIFHLYNEISKKHLMDNEMKMTEFLVWCSSYLSPAHLHKSLAKKGSSSVGKDNMSHAMMEIFPEEDYLKLTNATQAVLEDDIDNYKVIFYSEVNLGKDDKGANAKIVEAIKQLTEGGMSSLKKDAATGYKTTRHSKQEQKTVIYGTTESANDDELATRFMIGSVSASVDKIKAVNNNTCKWFAGIRNNKTNNKWFAYAVKNLFKSNEVIIPLADKLPQDFFDNNDPRSMRDCKRFLACASAVAWIYQLQRKKDNEGRIIAELQDLLMALIITDSFFNYTYTGLGDERIRNFIEAMNNYCDNQIPLGGGLYSTKDIFPRHKIQEKLGCSINTIKDLAKGCQDLSIIRYLHLDGNNVMYERCQKGVKKVLIGYTWKKLIEHFDIKEGVKLPKHTLDLLEKLDNTLKNSVSVCSSEEIDTLKK
jgi:hypothetical protein